MNIPALEANADEIERQIARLEAELEAKQFELRLTRNDIAAARLQAWYRAHPGIELKEGDELLVTEEFRRIRLNGWQVGDIARVEVCYLHSCDDTPEVEISENGFIEDAINIHLARHMRQAWLAQEAKS